jgi:hypothetical protein
MNPRIRTGAVALGLLLSVATSPALWDVREESVVEDVTLSATESPVVLQIDLSTTGDVHRSDVHALDVRIIGDNAEPAEGTLHVTVLGPWSGAVPEDAEPRYVDAIAEGPAPVDLRHRLSAEEGGPITLVLEMEGDAEVLADIELAAIAEVEGDEPTGGIVIDVTR